MIVSNIEAVARATQKITTDVIEAVTPAQTPEAQPQATPLPQQEKSDKVTYKGKMVDEAGNPLGDVQIITDRKFQSTTASITNTNGEFRVETSSQTGIVFLYTGKDGQTLGWGGRPEDLAKMDPDNMVIVLKPQNVINAPAATDGDEEVFEVVEKMPRFPNGGMPGLMQYLGKNIRYPEAAHKAGTQGRVTVQFVVAKDGSIGNVSVLRGVDPALDAEAIRVISSMPNWEPGMQKGKPVNVKFTVPVMFRLMPEPVDKIDEMMVVGYRNSEAPVIGEVYDVVEKMPEFPGGMTGLMQHLSKNIRYPAEAHANNIQGRVVVSVIINTEGKVTNAKIVQGVAPSLDAEALRVTGTMPDWIPGTKDGKPVNVKYTFPVMFRLQ